VEPGKEELVLMTTSEGPLPPDPVECLVQWMPDATTHHFTISVQGKKSGFLYDNQPINQLIGRVSDPDPYWIRNQSGQWIQIRIRNPDPGGQKLPTKFEKKLKKFTF
jgi:hypothetical protein